MPYRPNATMRKAAREALEHRKTLPPSQRFGTPVGLARARDIANNVQLSLETILRMRSFLARHKKNWDLYKDKPKKEWGAGAWSYYLWGGPSAVAWVEDKVKRYERAGELPSQRKTRRRG